LGLSNLFKSFFPFLIDINIYSKLKIKVLNSVDVLVPILPADYFLLKKYYNIDVPSFHLNYINPLFEKEFPFSNLKKNILLGNSSSYTNNHIEAIEILSKIVSSDYKIIIPLNYGDKYLSDFIIKYAKKKLLKNNLMFLTEFIEFDKYQEIISDCEIVIMNHLRQQALGNIIQAIYTGVHVYLNPSSPVYKYLLENDIFVSAFNLDSILCSLTETQKAKNRILIKNVFGPNVQKQRLKKLLFEYINLNLSK
jgi:UDP-N-acetylglucosamine transferase subunit ALG13